MRGRWEKWRGLQQPPVQRAKNSEARNGSRSRLPAMRAGFVNVPRKTTNSSTSGSMVPVIAVRSTRPRKRPWAAPVPKHIAPTGAPPLRPGRARRKARGLRLKEGTENHEAIHSPHTDAAQEGNTRTNECFL